jgi:probable rRNA maturation factor
MTIEVHNEAAFELDEPRVLRFLEFALDQLKVHPAAEVNVIFIDIDYMTELHVKHLDEPGPTDVMSFPMDELRPGSDEAMAGPGDLGEIYICPEFIIEQAEKAGHPLINEVLLLSCHGLLHLLGFDHAEPEEEKEMFGLQNRILADYYRQEQA